MAPSRAPGPRLVLTRRGRLLRTLAALVAVLVLAGATAAAVRSLGRDDEPAAAPDTAAETIPEAGESASASPAVEDLPSATVGIVHTGVVGTGTWTASTDLAAAAPAEGASVRTYAVRVEGGLDIDAEEAADEIAAILADERGWSTLEHVSFVQVASPEEADVTISLASPGMVDRMCAPARTNGTWSCRIDQDVVLNADRWTTMTPTFDDLADYRAYMVNHEVGHFLGHGHATCPGAGLAAPVMLQQSMDLGGCRPNAWPTADGSA